MSRPSAKKRTETDAKVQIEKAVAGVAGAFDALLLAVRGNSVPLTAEQVRSTGEFLRALADRSVAALVAANASAQATSFSLDAIPELGGVTVQPTPVVMREILPQTSILLSNPTRSIAPPSLAGTPPAPSTPTSVKVLTPAEIARMPRPIGRVADEATDGSGGLVLSGAPIIGAPKTKPDSDEATFIDE